MYNNHQCVFNKTHYEEFQFIYGDMINIKTLRPLIEQTEAVVLLAGLVGDPITKKYPKESNTINDQGVKNVIDLCTQSNTGRLIFVSTCSNYGIIQDDELADENFELRR